MAEPARRLIAERCAAQLLTDRPAWSAVEVVRRLLAVQGQDPRGARLAVRARSARLTPASVDHALTMDRSLLITWVNRGTLHLIAAEDYWWLHALTAPPMLAGLSRRLTLLGVSPEATDRAIAAMDAALASEGPLTRAELAGRITAAGVELPHQALVQLLARASVLGVMIRGPMAGRQHAYVRVTDWLGARPARFEPGRFDRDVALAELARRYLAGHGPASEADLAKWAGLPLRDVRRGLTAIASELADRGDGLAELAPRPGSKRQPAGSAPPFPPPRLLGSFDPLLHGWVDRGPVLGAHQQIVTVNGLFRPFALVDGRAAGTWTLTAGRVDLTLFADLPEPVAAALADDAEDVVRYLG